MTALLQGFLLIAPVVVAGLVHQAVRARGLLKGLQVSLDAVLFGGRLVFGANKTLRGFVVMPGACGAAFVAERELLLATLAPGSPVREALAALPLWSGLLLGLAYVVAELPNSFLKRRLGIAPGAQGHRLFFVLDHLDSALGSAITLRLLGQPWSVIAAALLTAPLLHVCVNRASHAVGLRGSPW